MDNIKYYSILDIAVVCERLYNIHNNGITDVNDEDFLKRFKSTYENFKLLYVDDIKIQQFLGDSFDSYVINLINSYKNEIYIKTYN